MKKNKNIYMMLPRFVPESETRYESGRFLPAVTKHFEYGGMQLSFIILPATIYKKHSGSKHYYPSEREKKIEKILRRMAVNENPHFIKEDLSITFNIRSLPEYFAEVDDEIYSTEEIELSLEILANVQYELRKGSTELNFHAIEELQRITENNEIFYYVRFSSMFLGDNKIFEYSFED